MLTLPPPIPIKSVWVGRMLSNRRHGGGASYRGSSNLLENHRWTNCHTHQSIQMRRRTGKPSSLTHVPRLMHLETSPMRHLRMEYGIPLIIRGKPYDVNMTSLHLTPMPQMDRWRERRPLQANITSCIRRCTTDELLWRITTSAPSPRNFQAARRVDSGRIFSSLVPSLVYRL